MARKKAKRLHATSKSGRKTSTGRQPSTFRELRGERHALRLLARLANCGSSIATCYLESQSHVSTIGVGRQALLGAAWQLRISYAIGLLSPGTLANACFKAIAELGQKLETNPNIELLQRPQPIIMTEEDRRTASAEFERFVGLDEQFVTDERLQMFVHLVHTTSAYRIERHELFPADGPFFTEILNLPVTAFPEEAIRLQWLGEAIDVSLEQCKTSIVFEGLKSRFAPVRSALAYALEGAGTTLRDSARLRTHE